MKIFSYMASGKPIVATNIPSHTQVLNNDSAFLCEPNPEAFANGILLALKSPEKEDKVERAKKIWLDNFTEEKFKSKVKAIFKELAS